MLNATWQRAVANESTPLEQRADLMLASTHAVRTSAHVADLMHRMGATSGIYERSRLERHFRDAQTVRQHGFPSESRFETVGQAYLGVEQGLGSQRFERTARIPKETVLEGVAKPAVYSTFSSLGRLSTAASRRLRGSSTT